jgi:hypothetical protein
MAANCASLRFGKNHSTNGRKTVEVLTAENSAVDANEMNSIQKPSGTYRHSRWREKRESLLIGSNKKGKLRVLLPLYRPTCLLAKLLRRCAGHDLNNLICDGRLADAVHVKC